MFLKCLFILEQIFLWPARIIMSISRFLGDLRLGLYYGYPRCCILQFCFESAIGELRGTPIKQGLNRGFIRLTSTQVYVPCSFHKTRHSNWRPHKQWLDEVRTLK